MHRDEQRQSGAPRHRHIIHHIITHPLRALGTPGDLLKGSGYASGLVKLGSIASGVEALANQQGNFAATIERAG